MSENYQKVKDYYIRRLWRLEQVKNAVGRWITEEEYTSITGQTYTRVNQDAL